MTTKCLIGVAVELPLRLRLRSGAQQRRIEYYSREQNRERLARIHSESSMDLLVGWGRQSTERSEASRGKLQNCECRVRAV